MHFVCRIQTFFKLFFHWYTNSIATRSRLLMMPSEIFCKYRNIACHQAPVISSQYLKLVDRCTVISWSLVKLLPNNFVAHFQIIFLTKGFLQCCYIVHALSCFKSICYRYWFAAKQFLKKYWLYIGHIKPLTFNLVCLWLILICMCAFVRACERVFMLIYLGF